MLGITIPDAIALGTLVLAVLAGLFGKKAGDTLNKAKPLDPTTSGIAAGFVDKDLMLRLVVAIEALVAMRKDRQQQAIDDRLERIEAALTKQHDDETRPRRIPPRRD